MVVVHSYGSKSIRHRLYEVEKKTGVEPSPLQIIREVNKKNKANQEEVGEYSDPKIEAIIELYEDDIDPMTVPIFADLWKSIEVVQAGLSKGRILGVGSSSAAALLMVDHPIPPPPTAPDASVVEDITRSVESRMQHQIEQMQQQIQQRELQLQQQSNNVNNRCSPRWMR